MAKSKSKSNKKKATSRKAPLLKSTKFAEILAGEKFSPSALFNAREIGGWWDASDRCTLLGNYKEPVKDVGEAVKTWLDKSPNKNHVSESSNCPSFQGPAGIRFDGIKDILWGSALGLHAAGACSAFAAFRAHPGTTTIAFGDASSIDDSPIYSLLRASSPTASDCTSLLRNDTGQTIAAAVQYADVFDASARIYGVIDNGELITGYRDGVAGISAPYQRSGTFNGIDRFAIGGLMRRVPSAFFSMDLFELIIIGRILSDDERNRLEEYLAEKWLSTHAFSKRGRP